jgi:hypothetical protein
MDINSKYKNSIFSSIFGDPETLRELYSAITGVPVDPSLEITINTLSDVIYMERYNDISFVIGNILVIIVEHQSTINFNMPLRFLSYIARVYEKIVEQYVKGSIYKEKLIKIPAPEFLVLYNGVKPCPDQMTLKLSDAFENIKSIFGRDITSELELIVKVYNINKGHNEDILHKCEALKGYSYFIDDVRERRKTMPFEEALKASIDYSIRNGILSDFLTKHSSEVRNMLSTEWNWDDAKEVWQEEAREEGREEGLEKGREEERITLAKKALSEGIPIEIIQKLTGFDSDTINSLV